MIQNKKKITKFLWIILVLNVQLLLMSSCSSKTNYDLLTIFFDDVPLPDSTSILQNQKMAGIVTSDTTSPIPKIVEKEITHPPAEEGSCNNCHDTENSFVLNEPQPGLCYNCHDNFSKKYTFLHGPVIIGSCTSCHDPHKSVNQSFLKNKGQDVCTFCHNKEDILRNDVHSSIEDTKCWECHNPHGGSEKTFMK